MRLNIPKDVERIDLDADGVDDVAISVSEGMPDDTRHVFWFYAKKGKITVEHRVEDLGWFAY